MIEQLDASRPHHFYLGVLVALFGFALVWPHFRRLGVFVTALGMAVALDDFVTHATGVPTLLDRVEQLLYQLLTRLRLIK